MSDDLELEVDGGPTLKPDLGLIEARVLELINSRGDVDARGRLMRESVEEILREVSHECGCEVKIITDLPPEEEAAQRLAGTLDVDSLKLDVRLRLKQPVQFINMTFEVTPG